MKDDMNLPYTLGIIDDDMLLNSLLASYFNQQKEIIVALVARHGREFVDKLEKLKTPPDILLLDLKMDEMDGAATMEFIRQAGIPSRIIVLSSFYQPSSLGFMLKSGANAFQPKGLLPEALLAIVREVGQKGFYFSEEQINVMKNLIPSQPRPAILDQVTTLTKREMEILELICRQKTAKEIGDALFISQRTAEGHRNMLLLKTGAKNTAGLVIFAVQNGLIDIQDGYLT